MFEAILGSRPAGYLPAGVPATSGRPVATPAPAPSAAWPGSTGWRSRDGASHARQAGCTEVWTLADDDNDAALATYRSAGGAEDPDHPVMFAWKLGPGRHS